MSISVRALPQLTVALLLPVAIVLGVLAMPTTCRCGAEQPHSHTIFQMRHHHHGPTGIANEAAPAQDAAEDGDVRVEQPVPAPGAAVALVLPNVDAPADDAFHYDITPTDNHLSGRVTPPTAPPPQTAVTPVTRTMHLAHQNQTLT